MGTLYIVGLGPGRSNLMVPEAREALRASDVIVGYKKYLGMIEAITREKEVFSTGMRQERERVQYAVDRARENGTVSIVSSGDAGIYGIGGLVLELLSEEDAGTIDITVIPGITAASSAAAVLGAPLMHDFSVISLSDILTSRETIRKRLKAAADADFVTVLYNPMSSQRKELFREAVDIFLGSRSGDTPVGVVKHAGREKQRVQLTTLDHLSMVEGIDMNTTVVIGNSCTFRKGDYMITPRGYNM